MSLTDNKIKTPEAKKGIEAEYCFGILFRVNPEDSRYWPLAYRFEGKLNV